MSINQHSLHKEPEELSLSMAAAIAKTDRATLWRHIVNRNLRARQVGRIWIIRADDLRRFMAERERERKR
jgi:hypothetical protein